MKELDPLPRIVIPSYLGATPEKQEIRFGFHLRQRQTLRKMFPNDFRVLTIGSAYPTKYREKLEEGKFEAVHFPKRKQKWEKMNLVMERLYRSKTMRAVLFLDDDVVPREPKPDDAEKGMVNCPNLVRFWLEDPSQTVAPICYFASQGLRFDAFFRSNKTIVGEPAGMTVMGWAMMIRSDLDVYYTKDLITDEKTGLSDDLPFRFKCWAEGKDVVKHHRAFFKTFQGTGDSGEKSVWFDSHEQRLETNRLMQQKIRRMFPGYFTRKKNRDTTEKVMKTSGFGVF